MKTGFIGFSIMSRPMAKNLIKAGYELYVNNFHREAIDNLVARGATVVADAKGATFTPELVITMLPSSPYIKTVALDENGIVKDARRGLVYVDMSSIAPLVSREVHDELAKVGVPILDAPISDGEPKVIDGTLTVMVSGDRVMFEQVAPVLDVMAESVTHVGAIGAGSITKLVNQTIVAVNTAACAGAFVLAQKAGVDPEAVFQAICGGLAGSTVMDTKVPMMLARNFAPDFRINLHVKGLNNVLGTSHGVNSPLPLTAVVHDMMNVLQDDGLDTDDHSGLPKYYEKLSDIELRPGEPEE